MEKIWKCRKMQHIYHEILFPQSLNLWQQFFKLVSHLLFHFIFPATFWFGRYQHPHFEHKEIEVWVAGVILPRLLRKSELEHNPAQDLSCELHCCQISPVCRGTSFFLSVHIIWSSRKREGKSGGPVKSTFMCNNSFNHQNKLIIYVSLFVVFYKWEKMFKVIMEFAQVHTAPKWQSWGLNSGSLAPELVLLTTTLYSLSQLSPVPFYLPW